MFGPLANFGGMAHDPAKDFLFADAGDGGVRLSLDPLLPVPTDDQVAKSTIYLVPHYHAFLPLFDGDRFVPREVPWERIGGGGSISRAVSLDLSGLTTASVYDVYAKWNCGQIVLQPIKWQATTGRYGTVPYAGWHRDDGLGVYHGRLVRTMTIDAPGSGNAVLMPEWLYLGTIYTTATTTTEDSAAKRFLWNYYNRVPRPLQVLEATNSWSYTTAAWRQMNASAANQVEIVTGVAEDIVRVEASAVASTTSSFGYVGIGEDSTTTIESNSLPVQIHATSGNNKFGMAVLNKIPTIGYHYYAALEWGGAGVTFYGDAGIPERINNGLRGWVWG